MPNNDGRTDSADNYGRKIVRWSRKCLKCGKVKSLEIGTFRCSKCRDKEPRRTTMIEDRVKAIRSLHRRVLRKNIER